MKIGLCTKRLNQSNWYEELKSLGINVVEISGRSAKLYLKESWLEKIKPFLKGYQLSLHSRTTGVFHKNEVFTQAEIGTLKAEIELAKILGINEIIFHLKNDKLSDEEAAQLRKVIDCAKKNNVEMIYESNGILVGEVALDFLSRFPDVNYNLDLGHLSVGVGRKMLGMDLEDFLAKIRDRTVYVHAHGNNGLTDEHKTLREGTLDWRTVLDLLDHSKIRKIISETASKEYDDKNLEDLNNYLS